jgi:hypothetical protein
MVTDALLNFFRSIVGGIFSVLPAWNLQPYPQAVTGIREWVVYYDAWGPVAEILQVSAVLVASFIAMVAFRFILWIVGFIRGGAG